MEAFTGHKTDTIWFRDDDKIVHKWTYDDIDVEFDELYYIKDGKAVELDLKFYENKEGTFINKYNDEVVIRLTNEYNKLCVFFEIYNIGYHNKPTQKEFKQYVDDFKAKLLGVTYSLQAFSINDKLPNVDLIIMAVSDDSISTINLNIHSSTLLCHTSGSKSILDIQHDRKGVFYALQTFTKEKLIDWTSLPFLIQAEINEDEERLINLAEQLSSNVRIMNSQQRKTLHLSAVFSCNFANYL